MKNESEFHEHSAPPSDGPLVDKGGVLTRRLSIVETEVQLERNFSFLSSLGLAFTLLNSWTGMSCLGRVARDPADSV